MNRKYRYLSFIAMILMLISCKQYLDIKPDTKLAVPSSLEDLQLLLDNYVNMNSSYPITAETMSDNYYITGTEWNNITDDLARNTYIWKKDETNYNDWNQMYMAINRTNTVLDELKKISTKKGVDQDKADKIKGSALCLRSYYYFILAQLFAAPFDRNSSDQDFGLPLRISSDYSVPTIRSSVEQTYKKIILDLNESIRLLPKIELLKTRPDRAMAYGVLSKTYLVMREYEKAGLYADSCLQLYNSLMDFNSLNVNASAPISRFNTEVIFHARSLTTSILSQSVAKIDSNLYKSYAPNDLRKKIYFKSNGNGTFSFKGDYDGNGVSTGYVFWGIVTDDLYLIRAECKARGGDFLAAMQDLNRLLETRWVKGTFIPVSASGVQDAISKILAERRKELLFRGTRWSDLRRLKDEPQFQTVPKRILNGEVFDLIPNSPRYLMAIPLPVIMLTGIKQNP